MRAQIEFYIGFAVAVSLAATLMWTSLVGAM